MSMGLGLGMGLGGMGGAAFSAEATALFAAMSVQPSAARKSQIASLIAALKTAGVWEKLDWFSVQAAHDAQAGRINWKNPAQVATVSGSPTFTIDRGYTGDGAAAYLNTGWNPTAAPSPQYTQNSAHMGVWIGVDGTGFDLGLSNSRISAVAASIGLRANTSASSTSSATANGLGHSLWSRGTSTTGQIYRSGADIGSIITSSVAPANAPFLIMALNSSVTGTVTPSNYSNKRTQAVHWGSALTATEAANIATAIAAYMTAVGA